MAAVGGSPEKAGRKMEEEDRRQTPMASSGRQPAATTDSRSQKAPQSMKKKKGVTQASNKSLPKPRLAANAPRSSLLGSANATPFGEEKIAASSNQHPQKKRRSFPVSLPDGSQRHPSEPRKTPGNTPSQRASDPENLSGSVPAASAGTLRRFEHPSNNHTKPSKGATKNGSNPIHTSTARGLGDPNKQESPSVRKQTRGPVPSLSNATSERQVPPNSRPTSPSARKPKRTEVVPTITTNKNIKEEKSVANNPQTRRRRSSYPSNPASRSSAVPDPRVASPSRTAVSLGPTPAHNSNPNADLAARSNSCSRRNGRSTTATPSMPASGKPDKNTSIRSMQSASRDASQRSKRSKDKNNDSFSARQAKSSTSEARSGVGTKGNNKRANGGQESQRPNRAATPSNRKNSGRSAETATNQHSAMEDTLTSKPKRTVRSDPVKGCNESQQYSAKKGRTSPATRSVQGARTNNRESPSSATSVLGAAGPASLPPGAQAAAGPPHPKYRRTATYPNSNAITANRNNNARDPPVTAGHARPAAEHAPLEPPQIAISSSKRNLAVKTQPGAQAATGPIPGKGRRRTSSIIGKPPPELIQQPDTMGPHSDAMAPLPHQARRASQSRINVEPNDGCLYSTRRASLAAAQSAPGRQSSKARQVIASPMRQSGPPVHVGAWPCRNESPFTAKKLRSARLGESSGRPIMRLHEDANSDGALKPGRGSELAREPGAIARTGGHKRPIKRTRSHDEVPYNASGIGPGAMVQRERNLLQRSKSLDATSPGAKPASAMQSRRKLGRKASTDTETPDERSPAAAPPQRLRNERIEPQAQSPATNTSTETPSVLSPTRRSSGRRATTPPVARQLGKPNKRGVDAEIGNESESDDDEIIPQDLHYGDNAEAGNENLIAAVLVDENANGQQIVVQAAVEVDDKKAELAEKNRFYLMVVAVVCCFIVVIAVVIVVALVLLRGPEGNPEGRESTPVSAGPVITIPPESADNQGGTETTTSPPSVTSSPQGTGGDGTTPSEPASTRPPSNDGGDSTTTTFPPENMIEPSGSGSNSFNEEADFLMRDSYFDWYYDMAADTILADDPIGELQNPASRYAMALDWIVYMDPMPLDPNENDESVLRQRYLMVVLYLFMSQNQLWIACNPFFENVTPFAGEDDFRCTHQVLGIKGMDMSMASYTQETAYRWGSPVDVCLWAGVTCDGAAVTNLELPGYGLSGELPQQIGLLSQLTRLSLEVNMLGGSLPSELGLLTGLAGLKLKINDFNGELGNHLCSMERLTTVDLALNSLEGQLPTCLQELSDLKLLNLAGNEFTNRVPSEIGALTNLEKLHLQMNDLTGNIPREVCTLAHHGGSLAEISGDCGGSFGCLCCTKCCDPGKECL